MLRVKIDFQERLDKLTAEHRDYHAAVYKMLYTISRPEKEKNARFEPEHISVGRFYEALLQEALQSYGPLAYAVFCYWGVRHTGDIACAIKRLAEAGLLLMSPSEKPEDFCELPSLQQALERPYIPHKKVWTR